jgi:hypothetical protein
MATKTMLFGPVGRQVSVPYPESGMAVVNTLKAETTDLISGELSVYRPPVTYKTYNMSWKGGSAALQPLVDVHSGVYGPGPFYVTDPVAGLQGNNLLPSKWASTYMLAHVCNGWGNPVVTGQNTTPEGNQVTFAAQPGDSVEFPVPLVVPTIPGQPLYYKAWGSVTGSAGVRVYRYTQATMAWTLDFTIAPTLTNDAPTALVTPTQAAAGTYSAVKLVPYLPATSTLVLAHIDLAANDYTLLANKFRFGKGIGPVMFTGNGTGSLDSATIDRIGLSIDVSEVNRDPNN